MGLGFDSTPPTQFIDWSPCYRLIPSIFPPRGLFDRIADPEDFERLAQLEGLTNDRLRGELGELDLVPQEQWVVGPGATVIMAAFTHLNPNGSRFSDGTYGIYYTSKSIETAIAETTFHRERFFASTKEPAQTITMRAYAADLAGTLHSLIQPPFSNSGMLFDPDPVNYQPAQELASHLHQAGSVGLLYSSVRHEGLCAAVFRPNVLSKCRQTSHYRYHWNGSNIHQVEKI